MGLYGVMRTGVSGMNAQSSKLGTVADNIANSSTTGDKRAASEFSSLVLSQGSGTYNSGGVEAQTKYAITDQGEGSTLSTRPRAGEDPDAVKRRYRPCLKALEADYPEGHAGAAHARFEGAKTDHFERFVEVRDSLIADVSLWPTAGNGGDYASASKAAIEAIAVVTDALDAYWSGKADDFPFSAMTELGARMAAVWADCGKAPDLSGA